MSDDELLTYYRDPKNRPDFLKKFDYLVRGLEIALTRQISLSKRFKRDHANDVYDLGKYHLDMTFFRNELRNLFAECSWNLRKTLGNTE